MKRIITIAILFFLAPGSVFAASEKNVLLVVMEDHRGEKSVHRQNNVDSKGCAKLLATFRQSVKQKKKMQLTLNNPHFSGYVIELVCIRPDGTTIGKDGVRR